LFIFLSIYYLKIKNWRREKGEGRREKGEGRREKGEGRREKGDGRWGEGRLWFGLLRWDAVVDGWVKGEVEDVYAITFCVVL